MGARIAAMAHHPNDGNHADRPGAPLIRDENQEKIGQRFRIGHKIGKCRITEGISDFWRYTGFDGRGRERASK
ncbi:hypothetical protein ANTQUA_LOCUS3875 [Anthophora quadrimaculata]